MKKFITWVKRNIWFHKWVYKNPFNRRCKVCGQHQQKYCHDYKDALKPYVGWWEIHDKGTESKHYE